MNGHVSECLSENVTPEKTPPFSIWLLASSKPVKESEEQPSLNSYCVAKRETSYLGVGWFGSGENG